MKHKMLFSSCALLMILLSAGACFGVTVPGSDGTQLTLGQIPDIIRHVTGKVSGDLSFEKESLLVTLLNGSPNEGYAVNWRLYGFDSDGTSTLAGKEDAHTDRAAYCDVVDDERAYYSQRINTLTFPQNGSNGIEAVPAVQFDDGGCDVDVWPRTFEHTDENGNPDIFVQDGWGAYSLRDAINASAVPSAIENAMTVKGSDHYISAVLVRNLLGDNSPSVNLYFVKISGDSAYGAEKIPCDFSTNVDNCPKMSDGTLHFPASIAAGDFDNDGYRNELALTWSDVDHVYLKVLQLAYDTGTNQYSVNEIYSSTIHDYEYDSVGISRDRGFDMDGVATIYSTSVAAGNFDGLPGDEFAVVFRDNHPDDVDHIYRGIEDESYKSYGWYAANIFEGLTGGVNVVTHKWDGSTFQTVSARKTYDRYDARDWQMGGDTNGDDALEVRYYLPVAVKAVTADMNGDGRDEIVVQKMVLDFQERNDDYYTEDVASTWKFYMYYYRVRNCIDVWNFDRGSIQANPASTFDSINTTYTGDKPIPEDMLYSRGGGHYPRSLFLKTITRATTPYPFFEREFDIVKGKFTGRIGDVITVDDLIVKYPAIDQDNQTKDDGTNYVYSSLSLVKDYDGSNFTEVNIQSIQRDYAVGLMTANFLGEGVKLGEPIKITINKDDDYSAILEAVPYHVDNLTEDGTALTAQPRNFTLRKDTAVTYTNTSTKEDEKNLTYSMTKKAETIFALDSEGLRGTAAAFQGIRSITSMFLGSTDIGKKVDVVGKIWDKMKDTVETTTSTSSQSAEAFAVTITQQSNYHDSLYYSQSNSYLWRYPVLTYPAPDWLKGQVKDTLGSFDQSQVKDQQMFITFAMSEPSTPTTGIDINDTSYQPYHELGNLFSYPADLSQIEGYEGHIYMANDTYNESSPMEWRGSNFNKTITFTKSEMNQEETKKVNKAGAVTKFLSLIDNIFGTSLAHIPADSDSSFKRTVTEREGLSINIPEAYSGARFFLRFAPYLDVAGTSTVAFAVNQFVTDDALWGKNSLYSNKPDPSFVLPQKFNHTAKLDSDLDRAVFTANTNDPTALKAWGIRFIASDYNLESDNLLMKGVKYKIRIPVYNASFVAANNLVVRLSYAKTNEYNAARTHIGDFTFPTLPGRDGGNHRQYAEFEWTPNIEDGIYYLFADIDPDNKIDEVHENRHVSSRDATFADVGGNNMAYFRIGVASSNSPKFDRNILETASAGDISAALSDSSVFPYIEWVKADGLDLEDFIKQKVDGASEPIPAEVEVKYGGEYLMNEVTLIGYKLKPESRGKEVSAVTDKDIGLTFVKKDFHLFPGEDHKLHFRINPTYLEDGIGFSLQVHGEEFQLTDIIYGKAGDSDSGSNNRFSSSSGGGCEALSGVMAGVLALIFVMKKRKG